MTGKSNEIDKKNPIENPTPKTLHEKNPPTPLVVGTIATIGLVGGLGAEVVRNAYTGRETIGAVGAYTSALREALSPAVAGNLTPKQADKIDAAGSRLVNNMVDVADQSDPKKITKRVLGSAMPTFALAATYGLRERSRRKKEEEQSKPPELG